MSVFVHHIETAVPETAYDQAFIGEVMKAQLEGDRRTQRLLGRIYRQSGIDQRHSVISDFVPGAPEGDFYDPQAQKLKVPSTRVRNERYTEHAKALATCLAKKCVARCSDIEPGDISHIITVSCTGFFAPGLDYYLVKELGLPAHVQRYHLGFMGCYATFPALRMAQAFCEADPEAVVLVMGLELCTLHFQPQTDVDTLISTSVFADGAAAAIVSARNPQPDANALEMRGFATTLTPTGEQDMAWTIGDTGFDMVLSSYVPDIIESNIREATMPLLETLAQGQDAIDHWAIHPGGRAILDKVARGLELSPAQMEPSREILRNYGNMSSVTVLFILKAIAENSAHAGESVYAMAFGPGLTVESGLFSKASK